MQAASMKMQMDAQERQDQATLLTAEGQANQMQYNADVALMNAKTARYEGLSVAERLQGEADAITGAQRAGYAASGINPGVGSAALVQADSHANAWLDWMTALWNKETEAVGLENKATDLRTQASYTVASAEAATGKTSTNFVSDLGKPLRGYKA